MSWTYLGDSAASNGTESIWAIEWFIWGLKLHSWVGISFLLLIQTSSSSQHDILALRRKCWFFLFWTFAVVLSAQNVPFPASPHPSGLAQVFPSSRRASLFTLAYKCQCPGVPVGSPEGRHMGALTLMQTDPMTSCTSVSSSVTHGDDSACYSRFLCASSEVMWVFTIWCCSVAKLCLTATSWTVACQAPLSSTIS